MWVAMMPKRIANPKILTSSSPACPTKCAPRIRSVVDDDLGPGDSLRVGSGGKPALHVVAMNLDRESLLVCGGLGRADSGQRRHGVDRCRNTFVVRAVFRPLHDVAADDIALVRRDRRELRRNRHRVAAD